MAYDLENTFPKTYTNTSAANGSSADILRNYPYVCSRQALYKSIDESGIQSDSQRNPNSYTVQQITDKICDYWDDIMLNHWSSTAGPYHPSAFEPVVNNYRWDQKQFWSNTAVSFICMHDATETSTQTAAQLLANTDIVFLPSTVYGINSKEYKEKPFLGFDTQGVFLQAYGGDSLIREDDFGVELDVNGSNQVTGVTSGGTQVNPTGWTDRTLNQLLQIYDNRYYHATLNTHGYLFDVNAAYAGHDNIETSTKWYDMSVAKFSVTISGGEVTAIDPVSRLDGDGASVTGGWSYSSSNDYQELYFQRDEDKDADDVDPRILYRTDSAQSGYSGNKATVSTSTESSEFYVGKNLEQEDYSFAYAFYGIGGKGYEVSPSVDTTDEWYEINLPTTVLPKSVRIAHERPALTTTSRSLKTKSVGTGAHRLSWEFEYPPLTREEAQPFIDFFEKSKGVNAVQIYIPWTAMYHTEYWGAGKTALSPTVTVVDGDLGSAYITLDGHEPFGSDVIPSGTYANINSKTYRLFNNSGQPDAYGRVSYRVEPPLVKAATNLQVRTNPENIGNRKDYYLTQAQLVDDVLDYSVDGAGLYRIAFKFREVL